MDVYAVFLYCSIPSLMCANGILFSRFILPPFQVKSFNIFHRVRAPFVLPFGGHVPFLRVKRMSVPVERLRLVEVLNPEIWIGFFRWSVSFQCLYHRCPCYLTSCLPLPERTSPSVAVLRAGLKQFPEPTILRINFINLHKFLSVQSVRPVPLFSLVPNNVYWTGQDFFFFLFASFSFVFYSTTLTVNFTSSGSLSGYNSTNVFTYPAITAVRALTKFCSLTFSFAFSRHFTACSCWYLW